MAVIILIRHGKALTNAKGILNSETEGFPLVEEGRERALRVAMELKKLRVSKLFSSPVFRARETAEIIGRELGLNPIIDDRLRERYFGELMNKAVIDGEWKFSIDWNGTSMERWESIEERMASFMRSVGERNEIIVAVSHDDPIRAAIIVALGIDPSLETGLKPTYAAMNIIATKPSYKVIAMSCPVLDGETVKKISSLLQ